MDDKIIVTNLSALKAKYKSAGTTKIKTAVTSLIAADKKRGLTTRLINIDDAQAMAAHNNVMTKMPRPNGPTSPKRALNGTASCRWPADARNLRTWRSRRNGTRL